MQREKIVDIEKCYKKQLEIMSKVQALKQIYVENVLQFVHIPKDI